MTREIVCDPKRLSSPAVEISVHLRWPRGYSNNNHLSDFPLIETLPGAYNAGNQKATQERGRDLIDPEVLKDYGDGFYPLHWVYEKGEDGSI